ncbi:MAG: glycerophosphodiester phosphodiesterase [Oscillospiraceae bacterium]|nr:glycerophosphodiester phosphodiesterase [Oscillospiraceae bacterium]
MSKGKIICCTVLTAALILAVILLFIFRHNNLSDQELQKRLSDLPSAFTVTAHTGCMDTQENTLAAIEAGAENGAQIVEFDLNFDENKRAVLSHDAPVGGEVMLDEAFRKVSEYEDLKVNVDLKNCAALDEIKAIAQKYGILDRIFFTGVNEDFLESVRKADLGIPYYLNVNVDAKHKHNITYLESLAKKVQDSGAIGINLNKNQASAELCEVFHEKGLLVSVWTVNRKREMKKILGFLPDNITTRNPKQLNEVIRSGN